jgi:hypothetical protein
MTHANYVFGMYNWNTMNDLQKLLSNILLFVVAFVNCGSQKVLLSLRLRYTFTEGSNVMNVMFTTQFLVPRSVNGWKFTPPPPTHLVGTAFCTRSKFKFIAVQGPNGPTPYTSLNSLIINIILQHLLHCENSYTQQERINQHINKTYTRHVHNNGMII